MDETLDTASQSMHRTRSVDVPQARSTVRKPPDRTLRRWLRRGTLVLLLLLALGGLGYAFWPRAIVVDGGRVHRSQLQVFVSDEGQTRTRERYLVYAPLSGTLLRVEREPGDLVQQGEALTRVLAPHPLLQDPRARAETEAGLAAAQARQRQASSAVARAQAAHELATREVERASRLDQSGALATAARERLEFDARRAGEEVAAAQLQTLVAAADVRASRAALGQLGARRGQEIAVEAPIAGQVLRVFRESEGPIVAGAPILELGDPRSVDVVVDVLSADAMRIHGAAPIVITQWGEDRELRGRVRTVEPAAFTRISALGVEEQRVHVIATLEDPPVGLGDGYRVEASILIQEIPDALVIPSSAVFRDGSTFAAFVIEDGRARRRSVETGVRGQKDVEVTRGLKTGEVVILYPSDRIDEGTRVRVR